MQYTNSLHIYMSCFSENWWRITLFSCKTGVILGRYEPQLHSHDTFQCIQQHAKFSRNPFSFRDKTRR